MEKFTLVQKIVCMMLLILFLMGLICGCIIIDLIIVRPMQKLNRELLDYIHKCEYDAWEKINKK